MAEAFMKIQEALETVLQLAGDNPENPITDRLMPQAEREEMEGKRRIAIDTVHDFLVNVISEGRHEAPWSEGELLKKLIEELKWYGHRIAGGGPMTGYESAARDAEKHWYGVTLPMIESLPKAERPAPPGVLVWMEGGLVQDIGASHEVDVMVIDEDTEGGDAENIRTLKLFGDENRERECYVSDWGKIEATPEFVDHYIDQAREEKPAAAETESQVSITE